MSFMNMDQSYVAGTYKRFPVEIISGKGSRVTDINGKEYVDMGSGIGVTAFGFGDEAWMAAVTVSEAKQLFEEGIISGGMIPKVDCCIEAISKGVKDVTIMDGRVPHAILMELLTDEGAGTMVTQG